MSEKMISDWLDKQPPNPELDRQVKREAIAIAMANGELTPYPAKLVGLQNVVGVDEVGRGSFAGPLVTGAVVLPFDYHHKLLRDSKKLTDKQRRTVYTSIKENAIAYSTQSASVKYINKYGINPATFYAMHKCFAEIEKQLKIEHILVDGSVFDQYLDIPYTCVPKGDNRFLPIAAGAIIAKVERDDYMIKLNDLYPGYNWAGNKGYYCKKHGAALKELGPTDYHRTLYIRNHI